MKILVTSLPDLKRINPQRPHHILKHLSQKHEITVLSVKAWWLNEKHDDYLDSYLENIEFIYFSKNKVNPVFQELQAIKKFNYLNKNHHLNEYDIHLNFNSLIAGYYIDTKLKAYGIPTIFDVADDLPERIKTSPHIPFLFKNMGKFLGNVMFKKCIEQADKITTITDTLMKAYDFPVNKSVLIQNGVDITIFNNFPDKHIELTEIKGHFILGFVGVFSEWVDLEPSFKALKNLIKKNYKVKMFIVGDGVSLQKFKDMALDYGITDNIVFVGYVPAAELAKYIHLMDLCLVYYRTSADCQNSFPLKLLEYMACGKPVISIRLKGVEEVVQDRVFYVTSSEEIEQKIIELYYDRKICESAGINGMEFVRENYNWPKICSNFESVLSGVKNESNY